ncbi:uncharacterized protein LOC131166030 isoform X2 [Malania oleifera]|uniref:uncharacterized protein LOC131166030 isoform X2 n=1 Tax=Malania oleifera TaxID=397392 RepID=UPI0025AE65BC|nr:uncharacterized protein LOC131166030 isoform X2 [Malania oleifera]
MSTIEKLFVQIFERKQWIIDQVKHQTELHEQHLASKLLIEGFRPPPWLLSAAFPSQTSDPKDLKKEELISGILLTHPRPAASYSDVQCSIYNNPVVAVATEEFSGGLIVGKCAANNDLEAEDISTVVPQSPVDDIGGAFNGVPNPETSANSPQHRTDASISEICPELHQSLARMQRSRSRQRALELRSSAKAGVKSRSSDLKSPSIDSRGISGSRMSFQQPNYAIESVGYAKPSDISNESCGAREGKIVDCQSKEEDGTHSGRIAKSESSCKQPKNEKKSVRMDCSSDIARESGMLEQSFVKSTQQANRTDEMANIFYNNNESCGVRGKKKRDFQSKEKGNSIYGGATARSRHSYLNPNCLDEHLRLDKSAMVEEGGNVTESSGVREVQIKDFQGKEKSNIYCGRVTRSRSSHQQSTREFLKLHDSFNCVNDLSELSSSNPTLNLDTSPFTAKGEGVTLVQPEGRFSSTPKGLDLHSVREEEHPPEGNVLDDHAGADKRLQTTHSTKSVLNLDNFNISDCRVTESISAAPRKSPLVEPQISSEGNVMEKVSGTQVNVMPGPDSPNVVRERFTATSDCDIIMPKQLNFDDAEDCSLNYSDTALEKNRQDRTLEMRRLTLLKPAESLNELTPGSCHKKGHLLSEKLSLEGQEVLSEREEALRGFAEAHAQTTDEAGISNLGRDLCIDSFARTSNLFAVSSVKEASDVQEDVTLHMSLEFDKSSERTSLIDHSPNLHVARNNSLGSLPEKVMDSILSNVDEDRRIDFSSEQNSGELDGTCTAQSVSEVIELENRGGPKKPADSDFDKVIESDIIIVPPVSSGDLAAKIPIAFVDEMRGNVAEQKMTLGIAPYEKENEVTTDFFGTYICNGKDVACSEPSDSHIAEKSIRVGRMLSTEMDGSWPQYKRRRIEGQLTNFFSASQSSRVKRHQSILGDVANRYLNSVVGNSEAFPNSQNYPLSNEVDVSQLNVNQRTSLGIHQNITCHMNEGFEYFPELPEEDGFGVEGIHKSVNLTNQAAGDSQVCLEQVRQEDPTSTIRGVRRQFAAGGIQDLLHSEDQLNLGSEELSSAEIISHMREDDLFSNCSVGSPNNSHVDLTSVDQSMPVFEGFVMHMENGQPCIVRDEISFDELNLPNSAIERATVLEQLCRSASMQTPLSHFSNTYGFHRMPDVCQSVPNGLLEHKDMGKTLHLNGDSDKQIEECHGCLNGEVCSFHGRSKSCKPFSSARFVWDTSKPYSSPAGKLWEGITFKSGSSGKRGSLNPELACFTIREEETGNTDEVVDTFQQENGGLDMENTTKIKSLTDIKQECANPPALISAAEIFPDRVSLDSVSTEISFTGTHNGVKQKLRNHYRGKKRCTNEGKENLNFSASTNGVKKVTASLRARVSKKKLSQKTSLRNKGPSLLERDSKCNNIVSNIASFIPLVQQKQAAAVVTGKRDIKVKALEAAEAAKRLEEKRENERKMKKEALKLERSRLEQEKQLEQIKKKKEVERKKKEADMAAKKRLREDEERKEKGRKRKCIEEARRRQREDTEKLPADKGESQTMDEVQHERKESDNEIGKQENAEKERFEDTVGRMPDSDLNLRQLSISDAARGSFVIEHCGDIEKVMSNLEKTIPNDTTIVNTIREQSYEISPYQSSEDEEEEEDDVPNEKFIPSWSSESSLAQAVYCQQRVDPDVIFPIESFCPISEVLSQKQRLA